MTGAIIALMIGHVVDAARARSLTKEVFLALLISFSIINVWARTFDDSALVMVARAGSLFVQHPTKQFV